MDIRLVCLIVALIFGGLFLIWYFGYFRRHRLKEARNKVMPAEISQPLPPHVRPSRTVSGHGRVYPDMTGPSPALVQEN